MTDQPSLFDDPAADDEYVIDPETLRELILNYYKDRENHDR